MVSKEATLNVVEDVVDVVAETAETLERIPNLALNGTTRKQQIVILVATAVTAGGVGSAVSHFVTKKVMRLKMELMLEEQLEAARKHYTVIEQKPSLDAVVDALAADTKDEYVDLASQYDGSTTLEAATVVEGEDGTLHHVEVQETINVFTENTPVGQWNQQVEESKRSQDEPYVISKEEYFEGVLDYTQDTLTYYVGDDTLANLADEAIPVHEVDLIVGESNLLRFGHGSGEDNIVYVRNDRLEIDYEVVRATGKYAHEVAGFKHSDGDMGVRKFRRYDE